ncbi:hypothetical protein [Maribacter sp. 2307ULW6-5]
MAQSYSKTRKRIQKVKASPKTIDFLLNYSRSLHITESKGMQFESNLN